MPSTSDAGKTSSEPPQQEAPTKTKIHSIRRYSIGTIMLVQIFAIVVLLVAVNIVAFNYGKQIDLTRQNSVELSKPTLENLKDESVTKRDNPIRIIAVINHNEFAKYQQDSQENVVEHTRTRLQEYADKSNGAIDLEFVNPIIEPGRTQELSEMYDHTFTKSVLIIDARHYIEPSKENFDRIKALNPDSSDEKIIATYKEANRARHVRLLPINDLFYGDVDKFYNNKHFVSAWKDEAEITTNLMRAIEGKPKKVYFLYDKCRLDSKIGGKAPWEYIRSVYQGQNIQLEKISLANLAETVVNGQKMKRIPQDADGIAIISPSVDFTSDELLTLKDYWEVRMSSSVLITLDPEVNLPMLNSYLWKSGIRPRKDRIISKDGEQTLVNAEVEILQGREVNGPLGAKSTTFDGASQSIEIADVMAGDNVDAFALIEVAPDWWGETDFGKSNVSFDPVSDSPKPLYIGAAVTRGKLNDQLTAPLVSKLVILGNSDFLSASNIRDEQLQYIAQVGSWLVGREPLMNVKQSPNFRRKVFIAQAHKSFLNKLFVIILPAMAFVITGFVWNTRR